MALSREEIAAAQKMHDFVARFERQKKYGPYSPLLFLPIMLNSVFQVFRDHSYPLACVMLGFIAAMLIVIFFQQRAFKARYERERIVLGALEREHADELPWVQEQRELDEVERHLAAVHEIEREMARGRR
ncbi:MAG: hypothetical protein WDO13_12705 [Verrucomicrobiota bacterium]